MYSQKLLKLCTNRFGFLKTCMQTIRLGNLALWTTPMCDLQLSRTLSSIETSDLQDTTFSLKAARGVLKYIILEQSDSEQTPDVPFMKSSLQEKGLYTKETFPYLTLSVAVETEQTMEFIDKIVQDLDNTQFDIPELSILMKIYSRNGSENLVLSTYERMCEISDGVFDQNTLKSVIATLGTTSKWRKCFRLLDLLLVINPESIWPCLNVMTSAAREGDFQTFCDILVKRDNILKSYGIRPLNPVLPVSFKGHLVESYLSSVNRGVEHFTLENLFYLMIKYKCLFAESAIPLIVTQLERSGYLAYTTELEYWRGSMVKLPSEGTSRDQKDIMYAFSYQRPKCPICYSNLNKHELTIEEYEELRKAYFSLKGVNVYLKSKSTNIPQLMNLIKTQGPFDVVIDHLNVTVDRKGNSHQEAISVVKQIVSKGLTCLLVTRKRYFRATPDEVKRELYKYATIFVSGSIKLDDLNMLDAVFHNGFNTMLLSNDKFSDHSSQLGTKMKLVFQRWQSCRQITIANRNKLIFPESPDMLIQESEDGWHIPYGPDTFGLLDKKLLCVRRKRNNLKRKT